MNGTDLAVGSVAAALGLFVLLSAIFQWSWTFELPKSQWLVKRLGLVWARVLIGFIGLLLLSLGALIASGFAPFAGEG